MGVEKASNLEIHKSCLLFFRLNVQTTSKIKDHRG